MHPFVQMKILFAELQKAACTTNLADLIVSALCNILNINIEIYSLQGSEIKDYDSLTPSDKYQLLSKGE